VTQVVQSAPGAGRVPEVSITPAAVRDRDALGLRRDAAQIYDALGLPPRASTTTAASSPW